MICANERCSSGIRTPARCPALGSCAEARPVKTVMDALREPERLMALLEEVWNGYEPWTMWACRACVDGAGASCPQECPWAGKDRELIRAWLNLPEGVGMPRKEA